MATTQVKAMVEGGKATAGPPIGSSLGPLGVNIGKIVADINKKTADFKNMQVPVTISVDTDTKDYEIEIGTPPVSALVKKEAGIEKGASNPLTDKVADLRIEQIIKIAKMKESALLGKTIKEKVREVIGTCQSMGVLVGGVPAQEALAAVASGKYDHEISTGKTERSAEELKVLEEEKKRLNEQIAKRRAEFEKTAKDIIASMTGAERGAIKTKLHAAKIPEDIIKELLPAEAAAAPAGDAKAAAPAAAKAAEKKK